jgi:transcriptional regulator with GAF, ATPase, and Fis domain
MAPVPGPGTAPGSTDEGTPSQEDSGTGRGGDALAQHLSELARVLQHEDDPGRMVDEIVDAAVRLIPGVEEGSISTVRERRSITALGASGRLPEVADRIQQEAGQGPCFDAAFEHQTVRVPDMAHEERWPEFARRAHDAGVGSMLSFQLFVEGDNLGALNLYSSRARAFDDESEHVGLLFASHAAVAFAELQKVENMGRAMATRDLIGQAKGILMERYTITGMQAFGVLTRFSQAENRKLRDIAQELVDSVELVALERRASEVGQGRGRDLSRG